ncbi:hypothetical protein HID58_072636, partial [Brassica napus]
TSLTSVMVLLWCGKIKLSKPYLALATQTGSCWFSSRGALSHHHHHHSLISNGITKTITRPKQHLTWHTWTQNPILGQHRIIIGHDVFIEKFDGLAKLYDRPEALEIANNGYGDEAISFFTRFKREGNKLDGEIFKEIFSAYALTGDVKKGLIQFEAMQKDYGIKPSMEHYNNVTKMLATSGHLDEALSFIEKMPVEPSVDVCAELVEKLDDTRLDKVSSAGLVANNKRYRYFTSRNGYDLRDARESAVTNARNGLCSTREWRNERVEKENKQEWTFGYKEEVAVVKKLLDSRPRSSVTVISNFRICQDSHDALKLMSEITGRQLIKRDSKKFHQFGKGICSCKLVS